MIYNEQNSSLAEKLSGAIEIRHFRDSRVERLSILLCRHVSVHDPYVLPLLDTGSGHLTRSVSPFGTNPV
jgi:hypothetical protein